MTIRIHRIQHVQRDDRCDLSAEIMTSDFRGTFAFERTSTVAGLSSSDPRPDAFLVMLLMHGMKTQQDIWIEDPVDGKLLFHLRGSVQVLLRLCFPELAPIGIEAESRNQPETKSAPTHIATGFSGGIDSMQLIHRKHGDHQLPSEYGVTMLMHHGVGSVTQENQYQINFQHTQKFAEEYELELAGARFQASPFFEGYSFLETHTLRTVAATLSLAPIFKHYLFASGTDLQVGVPSMPSRTLDAANPILLPLLATRENFFSQFGGEHTRLEKILEVLGNAELAPRINVCARVSHDNSRVLNCGRCFKCFPVLLVAEAIGKIDMLRANFDLDSFRHNKSRCYLNFFNAAFGPRKMQTNRQVAWFISNYASTRFPATIRSLMRLVPDPISKSSVDNLLRELS